MNKLKKIIKEFLSFFNLEIRHRQKELVLNLIPEVSQIQKNIPEISEIEKNIIEICGKYSMTGELRMYVLIQAIKYVKNNNLEGDFVECGIWKGGNIILFQKFNLLFDLKKKIYGFDTFEGMSEPGEEDQHNNIPAKMVAERDGFKNISDWCRSSHNEVKKNICKNTNIENIYLVKGKVENTLLEKKILPEKISILRLDTDWYQSTKIELEVLFKKLVSGGVLIIDDYGHWQGARKAVDEYFKGQNIWLHYVDNTCRYLIKK
jgi:hypothetical protein